MTHVRISQKVKGVFNMKSLTYYFHIKTRVMADFQICISVPLMASLSPTFQKKLTYLTNFSANNASFYKLKVLSQNLI